jgi:hypothetical protein
LPNECVLNVFLDKPSSGDNLSANRQLSLQLKIISATSLLTGAQIFKLPQWASGSHMASKLWCATTVTFGQKQGHHHCFCSGLIRVLPFLSAQHHRRSVILIQYGLLKKFYTGKRNSFLKCWRRVRLGKLHTRHLGFLPVDWNPRPRAGIGI